MDLFDLVRAAPPPQTVREPAARPEAAVDAEPITKRSSLSSPLAISAICKSDDESDRELPARRAPVTSSPICGLELEDKVGSKQPESVSADHGNISETEDADGDDDEHRQLQPLKTKAQQKMFLDLPLPSKASKGDGCSNTAIKRCVVRIKRMQQSEIERLLTCIPQKVRKRGRPRKSLEVGTNSPSLDDSLSPSKKQKLNSPKVHIKGPWMQNGSKQRNMLAKTRAPTPPPPNLSRSPKHARPHSVRKELVKRYGSRFFNCVVRLKRIKGCSPSTPKHIKRKSKSKLSVSFSEAVEILGSKPRKSSSIASSSKHQSKLCASVPTRLQRVDPKGNVLEDIELSPNVLLKSSAASSSYSSLKSRSSCNGGRRGGKLKRPAQRVPVTGLASLSIDDSRDEAVDNEAGDEYIVPNEVHEHQTVRRAGTPKPLKRLTVTTTVSDDEANDVPELKVKKEETGPSAKEPKSPLEEQKTAKPEPEPKPEPQAEAEPKPLQQSEQHSDTVEKPEDLLLKVMEDTEEQELVASQQQTEECLPERKVLKASSPVSTAIADDVTTDDILEIQASLEDVRELHTPPSRQSTPQKQSQQLPNSRSRLTSPESDTSFKSAAELDALSEVPLTDPPAEAESALSTLNGGEPAGSSGSITEPRYSPIDEIPNLDDDVLGQLVEPDFQLSSSRHAISRGTLDDIMTVLES